MSKVEMELLTDAQNNAVVLLPGRKYPGVVIQGDSLSVLITSVSEAIDALGRGDATEAQELLGEIAERLQDARDRYETALRDRGIALPY